MMIKKISKFYSSNQDDDAKKIVSSLLVYFIVSFFITGLYCFVEAAYDFLKNPDKKIFLAHFLSSFTGYPAFCIGFISLFTQTLIGIVNYLHRKFLSTEEKIYKYLDSYQKIIDQKLDGHLKNYSIVFGTGIKDYDDKYLLVLQKILNKLDKGVRSIYVLDYSDPMQWWSDSMTGYLSLLAKWRADCGANRKRQIHRIFVFNKNELSSPVTVKTIAFHSLLGFHTYIFEEEQYKILFEEYKKSLGDDCKIRMKELLLWDIDPNFYSVSFKIDNDEWDDILFYQSFWDIDRHQKRERENLIKDKSHKWIDYHGCQLKSEKISIWFEFMPKNSTTEIMAKQHVDFVKFLISKSYCCRHEYELEKKLDNNPSPLGEYFGVEIKTGECLKCDDELTSEASKDERCLSIKDKEIFEYVSTAEIRNILETYNNKIKGRVCHEIP